MVDAFFFCLDVTVKHGGIRRQADFVRLFCRVQPDLPTDLVIANDTAHARMENFRTAAGTGIDASFFHAAQRFFDGDVCDARKVMHLHHGEGFQVHARAALL